MEQVLVSKMEATMQMDREKATTDFAKNTSRITRYSLSDEPRSVETEMDYHIQVITQADKPKVIKFLRRFFFRDEPLNHSLQIIPEGEDSTCVELEDYTMSSIDENLSLMAVSARGAVIGVLMNGEMCPPKDEEPDYIRDCGNPKFKKILQLLHKVDKCVDMPSRFPGQRVLEFRIISVDNSWRGRGVGRALINKTEQMAEELGFNVLRSDCTSLFSGKLVQRFGFEPIFEVKYCEHVDEGGKPIFTPAQPHTAVVVWVKKL